MTMRRMLAAAAVFVLVLAGIPAVTLAEGLPKGESTVLLRKAVGNGEIVCSAGPNLDPALLRGLVQEESVARNLAVYEMRMDWLVPGNPPLRLWSSLFGIGKRQHREGHFEDIDPASPKVLERAAVLDLTLIRGEQFVPARVVLAQRLIGGGTFALYRIDVWGREVLHWYSPAAHEWSEYDTKMTLDPEAIILSVLPDGRCNAEVRSGRVRTTYLQLEGKWEFAKQKQWRE